MFFGKFDAGLAKMGYITTERGEAPCTPQQVSRMGEVE